MITGNDNGQRKPSAMQCGCLRGRMSFMRTTALVVLIAFVNLTLQPLAIAAASASPEPGPDAKARRVVEGERLHGLLEKVERQLAELESKLSEQRDTKEAVSALGASRDELEGLDRSAREDFARTEEFIRDKKLPQVILDRHLQAVRNYEKEMSALKAELDEVRAARTADERKVKTGKAKERVLTKKRMRPPVDPNYLPFQVPEGKARKPKEKAEDFRAVGVISEPVQVASAALLSGMLVAAAGTTPSPADLAANQDVQITPEIEALAAQLGRDPVAIYNWVRNNIDFVPTYGSIQGSHMTLMARRGNAFDTASLLIALLRASGIPARYMYGTIQVPADRAMNWVGGVTTPEAAQQLLGQGGIPNVGLVSGGRVVAIKMEHVWVEAFLDYLPGRGSRNGAGESWVQIDASFKQFSYPSLDIRNSVPFDPAPLAEQIKATTQFNEQEGWAGPIDNSVLEASFRDHYNQVLAYLNTAAPDATVADVLGARTIVPVSRTILASSLPYKLIAVGNRYSTLPSNQRHKFRYSLYTSSLEYALQAPAITVERSLPEVAGRKITITFRAATPEDQLTALAFLENAGNNLGNLPSTIPGYLINVVADIKIGGTTVATSGAFRAGTELIEQPGVYDPTTGWSVSDSNTLIAGETRVYAVDTGYVPAQHLQALSNQLQATKDVIDAPVIEDVDPDAWLGDALYATILMYFKTTYRSMMESAAGAGVVAYRKPGYGSVTAALQPLYFFGMPRDVRPSGFDVDVDRMATIAAGKDNSMSSLMGFMIASGGYTSYFEGYLPSKMLSNAQAQPGPSAAYLLALANSLGQTTYTIEANNLDLALGRLSLSADLADEIRRYVGAGKIAIIHQSPVAAGNWRGYGYVILDKQTGAGAYKISGGLNGGGIHDNYTGVMDFLGILLGWARDHNNTKYLSQFAASPLFKGIASWFGGLLSFTKDYMSYSEKCGGNAGAAAAGAASKVVFSEIITKLLVQVGIRAVFGGLFIGALGALLVVAVLTILISFLIQQLVQKAYDEMIEWACEKTGL